MKSLFYFGFAFVGFLLITSCGTPIEEYQAKNNDEKEVIDLLIRYTDIINTGDTEKILTLFHENGEYVTGRGLVSLSKEKMSKRKPEDWLDDGIRKLYDPKIEITNNEAKVYVQARFGNYKTRKVFTLVKENAAWIIMKRDSY